MIRYQIRSVALLNIVNDINTGRLIPDAYFQRNLVWREIHKKDFIQTILSGFPFPQMFFSRGKIDVSKMQSLACIVDGQQRSNAILEYVDNKFSVDGKLFRDLSESEKSNFLKYEVGVVELDLENDDPKIIEIFKRLNRTSNSLTVIEKLASEFAPTEYMFTARLLANDVDINNEDQDIQDNEDEEWRNDPNVPEDLFTWAQSKNPSLFSTLCERLGIFSDREIARKVHLMYVLNIMSTVIAGFFNRNEKTTSLLEDLKDNFNEKDKIYGIVLQTFKTIEMLSLPKNGYWSAKANFFSLAVGIAKKIELGHEIDVIKTKKALDDFAKSPPTEYSLAAREGVNNRKERQIRDLHITKLF